MIRLLFFICLFLPSLATGQGDWLVRYAPGHGRNTVDSLPVATQPKALYPGSQWQRLHFDQAPDPGMISRLRAHPGIASLEREVRFTTQNQPDDPGLAEQWALSNTGQAGGPSGVDIRALDAWDVINSSEGITVAVIDAGIDWQHPDLVDNIWQNLAEDADGDGSVLFWNGSSWEFDPDDINGMDDDGNGYVDDFIGWDFVNDDNDPSDDHQFGHGTHVAGIIAARGNNGIGITGVSWRSQIMALKFLDANGTGFRGNAIDALRYARLMGADLSNHSWGGGLYSQALRDEFLLAGQAGMMCIAAAGNNFGNDNDEAPLYPASFILDNIISVSATDPVDSLAPFANRGLNSVDLCAPGYGIYSTLPNGQYGFLNGTSMAAPFVTGALALLKSQRPTLGVDPLRQQLLRSVRPLSGLRGICVTGGRLDLLALLQKPLLFQRSLSGNILAGAALSDGSLIAVGDYQDSMWVASLQSDGQVTWSFVHLPGQWHATAASPNGGAWLAGQTNGTALLAHLDSLGQLIWVQQVNGSSPMGITQLMGDNSGIWATGWNLSGGDTAIWMLQINNGGQITQQRQYVLPGSNLLPVALANNRAGELGLLARVNAGGSAWMRFDSQGILLQADQLDWADMTAVLGQSLWGKGDEWWICGQRVAPGGERQLFVLEWEDDDGYEEIAIWPVGQGTTPAVSGAGRAGSRWLSSGAAGFSGPGMRLIHLDQDGDEALRRSYTWPGEAVVPVWVGQARAGQISWLLQRPGGGSYWGQTDEQGTILCFLDTLSFSQQSGTLPAISQLSLNTQGGNLSLLSTTLPASEGPGSSSLLCDNSQCNVEAFFSLPSLTLCEEGDLIPDNLSQNASRLEWWLAGELVDTAATPLLLAPDDEGDSELLLVAFEGQCIDTFRLPLLIEPPIQEVDVDTIHCGQRLTLRAAKAHAYTWKNDQGDVVGEDPSFTFQQSGSYELELTNACGEITSMSYEILLQGDCVWPGDVSADGQVDMVDYLLLSLVHGQSGPPRANASGMFTPQAAPTWNSSFQASNPWASGVNLAHADANGDGLIDAEFDGALVRSHYNARGLPRVSPDSTASVNISLELDTTVVRSGDSVGFEIMLTTANGQPISEAYALALTIEASVPLSKPMEISPESSWLTGGSAKDTLLLREPNARRIQAGLVRLDQQAAAAGAGQVMKGIIIVIVDDIGTYATLASRGFLSLAVSEALLIRPDGSRIDLNPLGAQATRTLEVLPPSNQPVSVEPSPTATWRVFPNPTDSRVEISGEATPGQDRPWQLWNLHGQLIASGTWKGYDDRFGIDLGNYPEGYYLLQIQDRGHIQPKKIWLRK